ncbi:MAG: hybrid sensor histidine kinase/response regulator, partial [Gammaproteobacteria bacterium]|nr:hybrid sensor histidine kinase/response regulator [Gammaproteobacteria bacterium]
MTLTTTNTFYPEEFNRRVLLIDDNAAIIEDFRKVLTFDNDSELSNLSDRLFGTAGTEKKKAQQPHPVFQVDAALRGEDGYEMVAKGVASGQPYAMAFVDMRMPMGWDGLKTIQQLWSVDPHLEVVICTAYSDYTWDDMIQGLEQQDHLLLLKKPFEPIEVCQLCLSLTEKWNLSRIARLKMEEMNALVESKTAEVIEANKAKSRFLNILGHEFLTPLNGVLGFAQVLRSQHGEDMDDQAINCLDYIEISGEKLHQLVSDLLDFVSSTSG